jgi:hypothetical protein
MATLYDKLQLKGHQEIIVLQAPESFERELARLPVTQILRQVESAPEIHFSLAFVTKQSEVDALATRLPKGHRRSTSVISIATRAGL